MNPQARSALTHITTAILLMGSPGAQPVIPTEAAPLLSGTPVKPAVPADAGVLIEALANPPAGADSAYRVASPGKLEKSHTLALNRSFTQAVAKDQVCLFVLKARTVSSDAPDGKGRVICAMQNTKDYSATPLWRTTPIEREWETVYFAFQASHPVPAGAGAIKLAFGECKQEIEIASFQVYLFPVGFDIFKAPRMPVSYGGREPGAPWRNQAEERIATLRQGQWTIKVTDAANQPIEGAKISVRMKRHHFGFGSAVDVNMLSGLGFKISEKDQIKYRNTVDELFSRVVPEGGLRVKNIDADPDPAKPWEADNRLRTKAAVQWTLQWAKDRKMTSRGHYLSWGYLEPWARDIVKAGGPKALLAAYDRHFRFVLPFTDPYVCEWDALNHPVPFVEADALYNVIDPDIYPTLYKTIRPLTNKPLFVNEDTFNPERTAGFEKHVKHMIANGQTPDGCGFQSHYSDHAALPSMEHEWGNYQRFGALVKHLTVTEYDLQSLDDQLHADHMRDMLTLCFSHPQMTGFVIWGFWETRHWKPTACMFKADWTERPAVKVWRDLVKGKWWTNADLTSDAKGQAALNGFFGWYDITVEHAGQTKTFEILHATNGGKPTLKMP
jgi:endo-1,4-beta-xylanase